MKYGLKKLVALIITVFVVSFLSFLAFSVISGDAAQSKLGTEATKEQVEALREEMGLDEPVFTRYGTWICNILKGDFGISYRYNIPVKDMIKDRIPIMIALVGMSFLFVVTISIPVGIFCASYKSSWLDQGICIINQIMMAVPSFFIGMILTFIFGLILRWFTPGAYVAISRDPIGFFLYLIPPSIAMAIPKTAMAIKILRSAILSQMDMDYVRTAYSRGNTKYQVLYHHVLRNALMPTITFGAMVLIDLVANSVIMEQVFSIPGLGNLLITSISSRDYPVVQFIIIFIATFVIITNFLVDFLYGKIDPRVRVKK